MPPASEIPLRRVTLNLYAEDAIAMETKYGRGWTEVIRTMVRSHVFELKSEAAARRRI